MGSRDTVRKSVNMQRKIIRTKFVEERQKQVICLIHTFGSSTFLNGSRDSSVSVVTRIRNNQQGNRGLILCRTKRCLFSKKRVYIRSRTHPSFCSKGSGVSSHEEKASGTWSYNSPLSRAEVKNKWGHSSTCLHSVHSNNVTVGFSVLY